MRTISGRCLGALAALSLAAGLAACGSSSGNAVPQKAAASGLRAAQVLVTCTIDSCPMPGETPNPLNPPLPTCSFASDPECTGIYGNGTPCDPFDAACGPGGNPFARPDPGQFYANQIAFHQPQCSNIYPAGTSHKYFHQCYVIGAWYP
jgi:hypothetical protein